MDSWWSLPLPISILKENLRCLSVTEIFAYTTEEGFFRGWVMNRVVVMGGRHLCGEISVGGSKNAALPLLFGGILTGEPCVFTNLPRVSDVLRTLEILRAMGAGIYFFANHDVRVDYSSIRPVIPPPSLTASIRGSTYLLGAMLGRFGKAFLGGAGGCDFGNRPIDQHLMGFAHLGATIEEGAEICLSAPDGLCGADITLAMPSVGATANLMLACVCATGESVIRNAAAEPHVAALADFLRAAGAEIEGVGTDTVHINGVPRLHGITHRIIPDMIEAGTYLCAGVACGGPVCVRDVLPSHLGALLDAFGQMGAGVAVEGDSITVSSSQAYQNIEIETGPYPAFPTDLHPQMTALFCLGNRARGRGRVRERIWASRFRYVTGLCEMGAEIEIDGDTATVTPALLHGGSVASPDLRGGAALLLAALATPAQTEITAAHTIARGYERLGEKLKALGADVRIY